jgi:hypothetical protein
MSKNQEYKPPPIDTCSTCMYNIPNGGGDRPGTCHRYAPHPVIGGIGVHDWPGWAWPSVEDGGWCGDFEEKPTP